MAIRKVPDTLHARRQEWSSKEVIRFHSYMQQALSHSMGRNDRVARVLCYLSLLRSAGTVGAEPSLRVVAARWQNYSSTAGNQAAHFLPGQLMVNSRKMSELVIDEQTRTRISCLFGDVEDLPADFNKADTQAEANGRAGGLCAAFERAALTVLRDASGDAGIDRSTVRKAYSTVWVPLARAAFANAQTKKAEKYTVPELQYGKAGGIEYGMIINLAERESATAYQQRVSHQQDILRHYSRSLDREPPALSEANMSALERDFSV